MKRHARLAAISILLALLLVLCASVVYGSPSWASYNTAARSGPEIDDFSAPDTTVYMQGVVAFTTTYDIAYYEADTDEAGSEDTADRVTTDGDNQSNSIGVLESELTFTDYPTADAGTWRSVVFTDGYEIPDVYNGGAAGIVENDSFEVQSNAIPEFPTVIAMIVAMGLSFGIYYWMRKRYHRQVAVV